MSSQSLPPEILDSIIDLLHDEPQTLQNCCLVAKSWIPRTRKHLFTEITIASPADLEAWTRAFPDPDPTYSPAYHAKSLLIGSMWAIDASVGGKCGWIRAFPNVVRLEIWSGTRNLHFQVPPHDFSPILKSLYIVHVALSSSNTRKLVCSLPLLEDLEIMCLRLTNDGDDIIIHQPLTSPPLTGTLDLCVREGMERTTRWLLDLPNGVRFRNFKCKWFLEEDFRWMTALVEACSDTLEYIEIGCNSMFLLLLRWNLYLT
jgi:hypothetical protein